MITGLKWLLDAVDGDYTKLHARVTEETAALREKENKVQYTYSDR